MPHILPEDDLPFEVHGFTHTMRFRARVSERDREELCFEILDGEIAGSSREDLRKDVGGLRSPCSRNGDR